MKKLISILLCAAMIFSIAIIPSQAESNEIKWDGDPVVFIQGYTGSPLIKDKGLETEETKIGIQYVNSTKKPSFDITKIVNEANREININKGPDEIRQGLLLRELCRF